VKALGNLLSNAVKFVGPGVEGSVEVKAELRGEFVRVSVLDNGIGIREADQEGIFKVHERRSREDDSPGTGMGLPFVLKGTERMGGRCGVESKLGQGSSFWIELRAWGSKPDPAPQPSPDSVDASNSR
jgi:signal transduction histidine kinase